MFTEFFNQEKCLKKILIQVHDLIYYNEIKHVYFCFLILSSKDGNF